MMLAMGRVAVHGFDRAALVQLRRAAGLTQEDLALQVGIGASAVRSWEAGRSEPSPKSLVKITAVLHVDPTALLAEVDPLQGGLAEYRRRADLTQAKAAKATRIPLYRWREIERGVRIPTESEAIAISRVLHIPATDAIRLTTRLHDHRRKGGTRG